ncbi:efflux transporter outer membrane subunit [Catenovulum adriaticum]|uniref:Efflux transporter outer membrane subunit n=1 Tax=Catenovulum adriaticum TaxID=2984846 RepID=A0ABY7AKT6_9ALTE|nr:efflux transporter outer membrane subunit [Catenovulum sp. TS8]WAJ69271.1 efflux transporter outer membrane subunit [Catenovulum sp. TS8]
MNFVKTIKFIALTATLSACQSNYNGAIDQQVEFPTRWQNALPETPQGTKLVQWVGSEQLNQLIETAIANNQNIRIKQLDVDKAKLNLQRAGAVFWPDLDFSLQASRGKSASDAAISNQVSAGLSASYEIDLWGKLSDAQKAAQYNYQNTIVQLEQAQLDLITSVSSVWLQMLASVQFIDITEQKLKNLQGNLDIIENGYRAGLNSALDVYLTRNNLEAEKSNLAKQKATLAQQSRQLSLLLGHSPKQGLEVGDDFPEVDFSLLKGIPSSLIKQRPDVQSAWLNILMSNANLAISHKDRFPSFRLAADVDDRQSSLSDLFSQGIAWSLSASVLQPIFDAGRLKTLEAQAEIELSQSELSYVQTIYQALDDIEGGLNQFASLERQLSYSETSRDNAILAEQLAFEQYQRGITDYTDYLSTQRTAFNAKNQVVELKRQIITNQIMLHQALGGDFAIANLEQQEN